MKVEIEARYYDINPKRLYVKLNGYLWSPLTKFRRRVWDLENKPGAFIRVREGEMHTEVTIKHIEDPKSIVGTKESSFQRIKGNHLDAIAATLGALGYTAGSLQWTKRAEWRVPYASGKKASITLDYWPGLKPLLEVEAKDEDGIKYVERLLKLPPRFEGGITDLYYQECGITKEELNSMPLLSERTIARWKRKE